jgi:hypothetical protein
LEGGDGTRVVVDTRDNSVYLSYHYGQGHKKGKEDSPFLKLQGLEEIETTRLRYEAKLTALVEDAYKADDDLQRQNLDSDGKVKQSYWDYSKKVRSSPSIVAVETRIGTIYDQARNAENQPIQRVIEVLYRILGDAENLPVAAAKFLALCHSRGVLTELEGMLQ